MSEYNDDEMTWDAWLWVAAIVFFSVGLIISGIALFGIVLRGNGVIINLSPTLPGYTNGVVGIDGKETTLQCQDCGALETPKILVLMTFKFVRCAKDSEPLRRCPECTTKHLDACDYSGHNLGRSRR